MVLKISKVINLTCTKNKEEDTDIDTNTITLMKDSALSIIDVESIDKIKKPVHQSKLIIKSRM